MGCNIPCGVVAMDLGLSLDISYPSTRAYMLGNLSPWVSRSYPSWGRGGGFFFFFNMISQSDRDKIHDDAACTYVSSDDLV